MKRQNSEPKWRRLRLRYGPKQSKFSRMHWDSVMEKRTFCVLDESHRIMWFSSGSASASVLSFSSEFGKTACPKQQFFLPKGSSFRYEQSFRKDCLYPNKQQISSLLQNLNEQSLSKETTYLGSLFPRKDCLYLSFLMSSLFELNTEAQYWCWSWG